MQQPHVHVLDKPAVDIWDADSDAGPSVNGMQISRIGGVKEPSQLLLSGRGAEEMFPNRNTHILSKRAIDVWYDPKDD